MTTSRYNEAQIMAILRQKTAVCELCREHGMGDASFYFSAAKSVVKTGITLWQRQQINTGPRFQGMICYAGSSPAPGI